MSRSGGSNDDRTQILNTNLHNADRDKTITPGVGGVPNSQRPAQGGSLPPKGTVIGQGLPPNRPAPAGGAAPGGRTPPPPPPQQPGETIFVPTGAMPNMGMGAMPGAAADVAPMPPKEFNPVVGWLVIVKGPNRGDCKPLHYGPNSIGRGDNHMIRLDNDQRVSRNVHAYMIYDDYQRKFYIRDNDANPVRYKGQLIGSQTEIKDREEVIIGETTLMFIALCNTNFDWVASGPAPAAGQDNAHGTEPPKA